MKFKKKDSVVNWIMQKHKYDINSKEKIFQIISILRSGHVGTKQRKLLKCGSNVKEEKKNLKVARNLE